MQTFDAEYIDRWLRIIGLVLAELRDVAAHWDEQHISNKLAWDYEWPDHLHRFESLHQTYRAGGMNEDQQARFLTLQHDLEENASLVESLGLQRPPVLSKT
jgi:hypothetical protein